MKQNQVRWAKDAEHSRRMGVERPIAGVANRLDVGHCGPRPLFPSEEAQVALLATLGFNPAESFCAEILRRIRRKIRTIDLSSSIEIRRHGTARLLRGTDS